MPRHARRRITVSLLGPDEDRGNLRLTDFIRKLDELRHALRQTERLIAGSGDSSVYWRVVDLRHESPATVVLEEVATRHGGVKTQALRTAVIDQFASTMKQINKSATLPSEDIRDLEALESYRALGQLSDGHVRAMTISVGRSKVAITHKFRANMDKIIGPDELELGSIQGMLEAINLHNTNRCNVFPIVGPKKVTCTFPQHLKPQIIAGIDRYVSVVGALQYKQWSMYPHAIEVSGIEVLPEDADLPTLTDLRGSAPGATGDMSSEDFVEALRDEW